MWMPEQIYEQADLLRSLGLVIDPAHLSNPASSTLQAVISLGFCSGSFVSREGLIITNHHCAQGMLSYLSKEDQGQGLEADYVKTGFHATAPMLERPVSPSQRVYVTQAFEDVTSEMLAGFEEIADVEERGRLIEQRSKEIIGRAEAGHENLRAEVKSFFRGERYILIKKLELKDIRMVYAPPKGVGFFGGDTDNWVWPRHTGDFALLRAYVAPDGSSQPYAPENVPFVPENFLRIDKTGLEAGDMVLVAGYPGTPTASTRRRKSPRASRLLCPTASLS